MFNTLQCMSLETLKFSQLYLWWYLKCESQYWYVSYLVCSMWTCFYFGINSNFVFPVLKTRVWIVNCKVKIDCGLCTFEVFYLALVLGQETDLKDSCCDLDLLCLSGTDDVGTFIQNVVRVNCHYYSFRNV